MRIGELSALAAAFCRTVNGLFLESAGKKMGSGTVNFIRLLFAMAFLSIYMLISKGNIIPMQASPKSWIFLSMSGIIGFFVGDYFLIKSMIMIGPRLSMLLMALGPPITAIFDYLLFKSVLTKMNLLGIFITLIGVVVVISGRDKGDDFNNKADAKGFIYGLLAAIGQASGLMLSKIGLEDNDPFAATQIRIISSLALFLIIMALNKDFIDIKSGLENKGELWKLAAAGLIGSFIGVGLSLIALRYTEAAIASTLTSIVPVMVIPFTIILYKEKINLIEIIGTISSVAGIAILFIL
ncbi:MAG: DMT family transporter [Tissierellia bacterium]|nr:DMT family transporter [Tissierellia bacterium]